MPSAFQRKARTLPSASESSVASISNLSSSHQGSTQSSTSTTQIPTHSTLRPSPFPQQQPLPLFSTGLSAINDVLTGVGLPSGCLALFQPLQSDEEDDEDHERTRLEAGAAYADLVLRYGAAQGIAQGHKVVVVGEDVQAWCRGLMGWAGEEKVREEKGKEETAADESEQHSQVEEEQDAPSSRNNLKSAFRYDKLQKIQASQGRDDTSSGSGSTPFVHPFDLTMRMSDATLDEATKSGKLVTVDVGDFDGDDTYEAIWRFVQDAVNADDDTPLRVVLPSLGSPLYSIPEHSTHATASYRLLLRLKSLIRSLAWPNATSTTTSRPAIALCTLSPTLIQHSPSTAIRLSHLSDSTLAFSSFASDARLRAMFCDSTSTSTAFTGSLKIIKTPTMGSLRPSSIRASTLRGMSSSGAQDSEGTTENSLGFKVRRKGFKVEVMGRDLVAGGEPGKEKPKRPEPPPPPPSKTLEKGSAVNSHKTLEVRSEVDTGSIQVGAPAKPAAGGGSPAPAPLKGIAALRARGLQAASGRASSGDDKNNHTAEDAAAKRLQGLKLAAKQEW